MSPLRSVMSAQLASSFSLRKTPGVPWYVPSASTTSSPSGNAGPAGLVFITVRVPPSFVDKAPLGPDSKLPPRPATRSPSDYFAVVGVPISVPITSPAILLTARRGVVGSHRLSLAEALRRDRAHRHSLLGQIVAHSVAALFGKPLIIVVPADAVRVPFYSQP